MKNILIFVFLFVPTILFGQNGFSKEDIKIALDTEIQGCRTVATGKVHLSSNGQIPLSMYVMVVNTSKGKEYTINFSCRSHKQLFIKKGKPILLKLKNGKVLTYKTNDDIDQNWGFMVDYDIYTNNIGFFVTRKQINDIIQGKIIKVRFTTDDTKMIDFEIENNLFSEVLSQQLKAIDDQMSNNRIYQDF